jgi:hypothetical protein
MQVSLFNNVTNDRRTRYCSLDCLEMAWDGHRHWCRYRRPHRTQVTEPPRTVDTPQVMNERETFEAGNRMETLEMV